MDVFFETENGNTFSIELGYWDTVLEIKQKIEKYQRIPVSKQTLFFNGKVLQDHLDIEKCDIFVDSRLQVLDSSSSPVNNQNHNYQVVQETEQSPPDQVIQQTEQFPPVQETEQSPQLINDQDTSNVGQVIKTEESTVTSKPVMKKIQDRSAKGRTMTVYVMPHSGEIEATVIVGVNPRDNVKLLRKELVGFTARLNLPRQGYFLTHNKILINEEKSYSWNGIGPTDIIKISPRNCNRGS